MVCYQEEVRDPSRIAEVLNRVIEKAWRGCGAGADQRAARLLDAGDRHRAAADRASSSAPSGGKEAIARGGGAALGGQVPGHPERRRRGDSAARSRIAVALAERLDAPVCCGYQHNDAFPGSHPLSVGPLGYNGSKAAMELIAKADVVLALGTRLNPFSTLPGYGIDYWPKNAKIIQVDINADRIGLTKKVTVGICGDAKQVAAADTGAAFAQGRRCRARRAQGHSSTRPSRPGCRSSPPWTTRTTIRAPPGTTDARERDPERMSPRQAWRAIQAGLPADAIISSDIGNNCAIGNAYPTFEEGRKYLAPGLFGPCGYGFPSIIGAKIGMPRRAGGRLCRRRRLRHFDERDDLHRPRASGRPSPW